MKQIRTLKSLACFLLMLAAVFLCNLKASKAQAQTQKVLYKDSFPPPVGYVNDYADLYSPAETDSLEKIIGSFEKKTTAQIALIVFKAYMVPKDSLEALTLRIGKTWGVGRKETNNGVVIGICPEYRKMTIRNGYGIEKIMSDEETKEIIDRYFIPAFKESKYFEGTVAGLQALIEILTKKWNAQKSSIK